MSSLMKFYVLLIPILFIISCDSNEKIKTATLDDLTTSSILKEIETVSQSIIDSSGKTLNKRIVCPEGFKRLNTTSNSYANYLRKLPLKPHGSEVLYFDGTVKENYSNVYCAVVDLSIGKRDLHQCADAIMRLRAEYLWKNKWYDSIHFNFTNGFEAGYNRWMKGNRIQVKGNNAYWTNRNAPSNTYKDFWSYMEMIFSYAGTLSLSKELQPVDIKAMQIGDIFIYGGSPGHAVVVLGMAIDKDENEKLFLLGQSYMPAQELQILQNPNSTETNPWYTLSEIEDVLITPQWEFNSNELMRFKN